MKSVKISDIGKFVTRLSPNKAKELLTATDPARLISLIAFAENPKITSGVNDRVAVLSGSVNEPELLVMPKTVAVSEFNFDADPCWDLCADWSDGRLGTHSQSFDLVLCEQVLEHLIDPAQAVKNLSLLLREGGKVHISVPGINGTHGLPHYFYAGFHPNALRSFLNEAGFVDVECGGWRSQKGAMMYAITDWTPMLISGFPATAPLFLKFGSLKTLARGIRHFFRYGGIKLIDKESNNYVIVWGTGEKAASPPNKRAY